MVSTGDQTKHITWSGLNVTYTYKSNLNAPQIVLEFSGTQHLHMNSFISGKCQIWHESVKLTDLWKVAGSSGRSVWEVSLSEDLLYISTFKSILVPTPWSFPTWGNFLRIYPEISQKFLIRCRWTTGILYDNINNAAGMIELTDRNSKGPGHGWTTAWSIVWNSKAAKLCASNPTDLTLRNSPVHYKNYLIGGNFPANFWIQISKRYLKYR